MTSTIDSLSEAFYAAMIEAWQAQGPAIIERVRREHPVTYLRQVASLLPRTLAIDAAEPLDICTDQDLEALRAFIAGMQDRQGNGVMTAPQRRGRTSSSMRSDLAATCGANEPVMAC